MATMQLIAPPDPAEEPVFGWKRRAMIPIDAHVAAHELNKIKRITGRVTPDLIVDAAASENSPLHPCFEWDDSAAAAAYRVEQARHLLRSLVVVIRGEDGESHGPTRYMVKLVESEDDPAETQEAQEATERGIYLPVFQVMDSEELRRRYVRRAFAEAASWRERYQNLEEFASIFDAIDALAPRFGASR